MINVKKMVSGLLALFLLVTCFIPVFEITANAAPANAYTIYYDANGGYGAPKTVTFYKGRDGKYSTTISSVKPARYGFEFNGWNTSPTGSGRTYFRGSLFTSNTPGSMTLFARWRKTEDTGIAAKKYTVTFQANGSGVFGLPSSRTVISGTTFTISKIAPTRNGYKFQYYKNPSTGATYKPGASIMVKSNITLRAVWKANVYTLTYNANGGSLGRAKSSQTFSHGYYPTVQTAEPHRTGFTFAGWNTKSDGSGTTYKKYATVQIMHSFTLYAKWSRNYYTIKYDANGGSGAPKNQTKYYGQSISVPSQKPTLKGYEFKGWSRVNSNGNTVTMHPGDRITFNYSTTLTAIWVKKSVQVRFDANKGSLGSVPSSLSKKAYDYFELPKSVPTRSGFVFKGWTEAKDGSGTVYGKGSKYKLGTSNVTLYAKWEANRYKLTFVWKEHSKISTHSCDVGSATYGNFVIVPYSPKPTDAGYKFDSWNTKEDGSGKKYIGGEKIQMIKNVTLYAQWTKLKEYTLSFDPNGGNNGPADVKKYQGVDITIPSVKPTRTGYKFAGWSYINSNGRTVTTHPGETFSENRYVTFKAKWEAVSYTIQYDANGGKGAPGSQTKYYGTDITISKTKPTRSGYTFVCWTRVNSAGNTVRVKPGENFSVNANVMLKALWKEDVKQTTYRLHFDANGGKGAPADMTKSYGKDVMLPSTQPTRAGYEFVCWTYINGNGAKIEVAPGRNCALNRDVTYTAKWKQVGHVVHFDANGGKGAPADITQLFGKSFTVPNEIPTRSGYEFVCWTYVSPKGSIHMVKPGKSFMVSSDAEFNAMWQPV